MININDLIKICENAGNKIMEIYESADISKMEIEYKNDNSPLTLADKEANKIICKSLHNIEPKTPILSEEGSYISYENRKKLTHIKDLIPGHPFQIEGEIIESKIVKLEI